MLLKVVVCTELLVLMVVVIVGSLCYSEYSQWKWSNGRCRSSTIVVVMVVVVVVVVVVVFVVGDVVA